jgi:acyl-CoA dehydrogenase
VLVRQCARFEEFSALPVGSTVLIGHWLRAAAGLPADLAPTVAAVTSGLRITAAADGYRVSGLVPRIVGARFASSLLLVARDPTGAGRVISICDRHDRPGVSIEPNEGHAPVALDDIVLDEVAVDSGSIAALPATAQAALDLRIGLLATVHIAGLLDEVLDLTLRYAGERQQFGRPISAFQMVKEMIALLAAEVIAAGAAADGAVAAACADRDGAELALRAAALRTGRAADIAARLAHQVHGTIGVTSEYPLHRYTTQLWHWRDAGQPRFESQLQLGRLLSARGPDGLWPAVAGS